MAEKRKSSQSREDVVDLSQDAKRRPNSRRRRAVKQSRGGASSSGTMKQKKDIKQEKKLSGPVIALIVVLGVLVIGGLSYAAFDYFAKDDSQSIVEELSEDPVVVEETIPENQRRIDGVLIDNVDEVNKFPVAVMIENLSTVRPQTGLGAANVVYETLAEGGITRFMAVFARENIPEIKPVRSARPYYLEWVSEYDALYVHAGGSPEALQAIDGLGIHDLDALTLGRFFWRGPGVAPHNLYTSMRNIELRLNDLELLEVEPTYDSWKFKDETDGGSKDADGNLIEVDFSRVSYNANFTYDAENNCYLRSHGDGEAHTEASTGDQLCPKNVVVQVVPPAEDAGEKGRISLDVNGEGRVVVFRDGEAVEGVWKKNGREDRTRFYDTNDEEIDLVRGQVWISIIPSDKRFEYEGADSSIDTISETEAGQN